MIVSTSVLPTTCVVVPTYWTRAGGAVLTGDAPYDHPTPVDEAGTLGALLESLAQLDTSSFYLLILVGLTGDDVPDEAERRVESILAKYPQIASLSFGPTLFRRFQSWLAGQGLDRELDYFALRQYARIRNLQLAVPHSLGTPNVVALDDDEIVTDPQFLTKAVEPLSGEVGGTRVFGLSGYYLQSDGGILLQVAPEQESAVNIFDRKAVIMNAATQRLEAAPGQIVPTPFCFGGNMEFADEMMARVGFDPGITRGEDIDYLINARMEGLTFFLRKDLRILHCPPKGGSYKDVNLSKLQQDILRFTYEQEKLRASLTTQGLQSVDPADLVPYPGDFLDHDLTDEAALALAAARYPGNPQAYVADACERAHGAVQNYLDFRQRWPIVMDRLHRAAGMSDILLPSVRGLM